jgi:hypothetical protein
MPLTLVVEDGTGKADANTLALVASVTAILEGHPFADRWTESTTQEAIAVEASAWLSRLRWLGTAINATQALAFPRCGLWTPDGYPVPEDASPTWLLQAHARLCLYLASQAESPFEETGLAPGSMLRSGSVMVTLAAAGTLPGDVRALIRPYIRTGATLVRA